MYENRIFKRDAFIKVTRETRATAGNNGTETYVEPALDPTDINYFRKHINESSTYLVSTVFGNPPTSYLYPEFTCSKNITHTRLFTGMSAYELSNHLGNVLATIKDEPILTPEAALSPSNEVAFTKQPLILTAQDYYPFGMIMPNRSFSFGGSNYRFGFNTQEKDDEVYGAGNLMTAQYWEYDARIGRRWNKDPKYNAFESRYVVNGNNPNYFSDPFGDYKTKLGTKIANFFSKDKGEVLKSKAGDKKGQWFIARADKDDGGHVTRDFGGKSLSIVDKIVNFAENPLSGIDKRFAKGDGEKP